MPHHTGTPHSTMQRVTIVLLYHGQATSVTYDVPHSILPHITNAIKHPTARDMRSALIALLKAGFTRSVKHATK